MSTECFKIVSRKFKGVFLAAMSSSKSGVVTQFVCMSVPPSLYILLVYLGSVVNLECHQALKSIKEVLRVFQGSFKVVSRKFQA